MSEGINEGIALLVIELGVEYLGIDVALLQHGRDLFLLFPRPPAR